MEIIYIIIYTVIGKGFSYRIFFELRKLINRKNSDILLVCPCMSRSDPFTANVFDLKKIGG